MIFHPKVCLYEALPKDYFYQKGCVSLCAHIKSSPLSAVGLYSLCNFIMSFRICRLKFLFMNWLAICKDAEERGMFLSSLF